MYEFSDQDRVALSVMLAEQAKFQVQLYGKHPSEFTPEERADYVRTMVLAQADEMHEALGEVGWKPWADSSHFNREAFVGELVDAWHFFMNLLLVADVDAQEFTARYLAKLAKNYARQRDGYDGVSTKCPQCKRDVHDAGVTCELPITADDPGYCAITNN
jgi:dUTPase-like protein